MLRRSVAALVLSAVVVLPAPASQAGEAKFPQLPLRRDAGAAAQETGVASWLMLGLLAAAGGGLVLWRRRQPGSPRGGTPALRSTQRCVLTSHCTLHVVQWQGQELLLGCTNESITVVARLAAGGERSELTERVIS